jgi:hypothetical protein
MKGKFNTLLTVVALFAIAIGVFWYLAAKHQRANTC